MNQLIAENFVSKEQANAWRTAQAFKNTGELPSDVASLRKFYGIDPAMSEDDAIVVLQEMLLAEPDLDAKISFFKSDYRRPDNKHVIRVVLEGQPYLYEVDGELYDALSLAPGPAMGPILKVLAESTKQFKLGATGLSTGFGVMNLISDSFTVAINSKNLKGSDRFTKTYGWVGKVIAHMASRKPNELIELYQNEGGDMSSKIGRDRNQIANARRKLMMPGISGKAKRLIDRPQDAAIVAKEMYLGFIDAIRATIAWSDMAPRLAEFEASLKAQGYEVRNGKIFNLATGSFSMPTRDCSC